MIYSIMSSKVQNTTLRYQLCVAIFYGFCSGSMNFLNKNVLSSWDFHYPRFLMLFQMIFLAIGIDLLKLFGVIRAHNYTLSLGKSCWQISLFFALNTTIALFALTGMNIPMYNAMRRCVPIVSLVIGKFGSIFSKHQNGQKLPKMTQQFSNLLF